MRPFQISRTFQGKSFYFCFSLLISTLSFSAFGFFLTFRLRIFAPSLLSFLPYFQVHPFFCSLSLLSIRLYFSYFPFRVVLLSLMVDSSKIRRASPSIAFLFAHLGALVDSRSATLGAIPSSDPYPYIGDFVVASSGLGFVLDKLHLLLHNSLVLFKSIRVALRRENMGSEMGSDSLERDSSSDVGMVGVGVDTTTSAPSGVPSSSYPLASGEAHPFHALKEKCSLKREVFDKFRDRFQFPDETRAHLPWKGEKACAFSHGEVCFYEAAFLCSLKFPVHPFILELLHYLNLAPGQLMPNSWRIVISCMVIWTIIADGDMITINEFVHLYRLKESKEFVYYEFVPWNRKSRLVVDLPLSFRNWKSRFFFVSGNGWETFSDDFWGDVLRLLRPWETPCLGVFASHEMFSPFFCIDHHSNLAHFSVL